jgi:hypothetical protein
VKSDVCRIRNEAAADRNFDAIERWSSVTALTPRPARDDSAAVT